MGHLGRDGLGFGVGPLGQHRLGLGVGLLSGHGLGLGMGWSGRDRLGLGVGQFMWGQVGCWGRWGGLLPYRWGLVRVRPGLF